MTTIKMHGSGPSTTSIRLRQRAYTTAPSTFRVFASRRFTGVCEISVCDTTQSQQEESLYQRAAASMPSVERLRSLAAASPPIHEWGE